MKIIEQYIYAIGQKLPLKGRKDVKEELRSLLLDEIEGKYGQEATEDEVSQAIADFGTPSKVAKRYSGTRLVIASGFTDLYFMIFKILIFAMAVAFTTIFFINIFTQDLTGASILKEMGQAVLNIWNTSLSGIGMMTIIAIIVTRFIRESEVDLEEDWTPKELKGIPLGDEAESKIESFVSIFFLLLMLVIINFFPQLISLAESSFELSGMVLGNRIVLDRFVIYAVIMSLIWIAQIVYHILILRIAVKTNGLAWYESSLDLASIIVLLIMVLDKSLFIGNPDATMPGLIGFKGIFLLVLLISSIELLVKGVKILMKKMEK